MEEIQDLARKWLNSSDEHSHNTNKNKVDAYCAGWNARDKLDDEALESANEIQASLLRRIELLESEIRKLRGEG